MKLKQISIFLENSPGRLYQITEAFSEAGINMYALTLADTADFGVIRTLVSDVPEARKVLMNMQMPAKIDEVIAVKVPDKPGGLTNILKQLLKEHINIKYMYAFTTKKGKHAVTVFSFSDNDRAEKILEQAGIEPSGLKDSDYRELINE